jgi:hypothetical protein
MWRFVHGVKSWVKERARSSWQTRIGDSMSSEHFAFGNWIKDARRFPACDRLGGGRV